MKLLIETTLTSYLVALINKKKIENYVFEETWIKKSERLDSDVRNLVKNLSKLEGIYVTNGPGSFMGIRAGLIYGYTLATALNISFFTASSLDFLSGGKKGTYYIDAKGGHSFSKIFPNGKIKIISYHKTSDFIVSDFLKYPQKYLNLFTSTKKPNPNYFKKLEINY